MNLFSKMSTTTRNQQQEINPKSIIRLQGRGLNMKITVQDFDELQQMICYFAYQAGFRPETALGNGMDDGTLPSPHSPNNTLAQVLPTLLRDRLYQKPPGTSCRIQSLYPIQYNTPPTCLTIQPGSYAELTLTVLR